MFKDSTYKYLSWYFFGVAKLHVLPLKFRRDDFLTREVKSGSFEVINGKLNYVLTRMHMVWSVLLIISNSHSIFLRVHYGGKVTSLVFDIIWMTCYVLVISFQVFLERNKRLFAGFWNQIIQFDDQCTSNSKEQRYPWSLIQMGGQKLGYNVPFWGFCVYVLWDMYQYYVLCCIFHVYLFPIFMYANCTNYWLRALTKEYEDLKKTKLKGSRKKPGLKQTLKRWRDIRDINENDEGKNGRELRHAFQNTHLTRVEIMKTDGAVLIYKMQQLLNGIFNNLFSQVFFPIFKTLNILNQCVSLFVLVKYHHILPVAFIATYMSGLIFWTFIDFALYSPLAQVTENSEEYIISWKTGYGGASQRYFRPLRPLTCRVSWAYKLVKSTVLTLLLLVCTFTVNLIIAF